MNSLDVGIDGPDFCDTGFQIGGDLALYVVGFFRWTDHFYCKIGKDVDRRFAEIEPTCLR